MSRWEDWDHCSDVNKSYHLILSFIWTACVFVVIWFLFSFLKQLYKTENGINDTFRRLSSSLCVCAVLGAVCLGSYYVSWSLYCYGVTDSIITKTTAYHIGIITGSCASMFYSFSFVLLLAIFLIRLWKTFENTTYIVPKRVYTSTMILIGVDFILGPIGTFIINYGRRYTPIGDSSFTIGSVIMVLHFLLYVIIAFYLLFLFIRSLLSVSNVKYNDRSSQINSGSRSTTDLDDHDNGTNVTQHGKVRNINLDLIPTITKYFLLVMVALCSSLITVILFIIQTIVFDVSLVGWYVFWLYMPFEFVCNMMSLVLQFRFNHHIYVKMCGKCHNEIKRRLVHGNRIIQTMTMSQMARSMSVTTSTQSHQTPAA